MGSITGTKRMRALLVAIALLAVACGGGKPATEPGDSEVGSGIDIRETTTTAAGGAATTAPGPQQTAPAGGTVAPGKPTTTKKGQAPAGPATLAPAPPGADPIAHAASGPPGGAAGIILQPDPAKQIVVEVLAEPAATVNKGGIDKVIAELRRVTGKPVSEVRNPLPATPDGSNHRWTPSENIKLADAHSKVPQGNGRFVLKMMFVKGRTQSANPNLVTLGYAIRGDLFVAFPDTYERPTTAQSQINALFVHEAGHLLGLVDNYLNNGRSDTTNDPAKRGHSKNERSVMYYAAETSPIDQLFNGVPEFDAEDLRDLEAIKKGARPGSKAG